MSPPSLARMCPVAVVLAVTAGCGPEGCNPCPQNQLLETTAWTASDETLVRFTIPPDSRTYCYSSQGWQHFRRAFGFNGIGAETYLDATAPDDGGNPQYVVLPLTPRDMKNGTRWALWLDCTTDDRSVLIEELDLTRATVEGAPFLGTGQHLSPYYKFWNSYLDTDIPGQADSSVADIGICVINRSKEAVVLNYQYYLQTLECRDSPVSPVPESGATPISCRPPESPPPPLTCSGQDGTNAPSWLVPIADAFSCGDLGLYVARSLGEAKECARGLRLSTPDQICEFELHLGGTGISIYRAAEDADAAIECARNTECSDCEWTVTAQGACVAGRSL